MVRRYCATLDQNYTKNKITICVHIDHIFDLYVWQRKPFMRTYAEKLENQQNSRYGGSQPGMSSAHGYGQTS